MRRATLAKDLATAAGARAPVSPRPTSSARRRTVTATVTVAAADPASVPGLVEQRLDDRLGEIGPVSVAEVRVRARADASACP